MATEGWKEYTEVSHQISYLASLPFQKLDDQYSLTHLVAEQSFMLAYKTESLKQL